MNIAFIPARCGSKSIPFKNIKLFCGKPLVYWSLKTLEDSQYIDKIYVATDCQKIKNVVNDFKLSKVLVYDREPQNAIDTATTESAMMEFIDKNTFNDSDNFFLVQATSPLLQTQDINDAYEIYINDKIDSLLSCVREKKFLWTDDGKAMNYDYMNRPRRQDFNGVLIENGAFYINSIGNIKKYKNRLYGKISIFEMKEYQSIDIDEEDDWIIAENLFKKYNKTF